MAEKKSCSNCMLAFFIDYGYSNYTVEGTYFHCGPEHHPNGSFDRFYGKDERLEYGAKCDHHVKGSSVRIDVDREDFVHQKLNPAQIILLRYVDQRPDPPTQTGEDRKKYYGR